MRGMVARIEAAASERRRGIGQVAQVIAPVDKNSTDIVERADGMTRIGAGIADRVDQPLGAMEMLGELRNRRAAAGVGRTDAGSVAMRLLYKPA